MLRKLAKTSYNKSYQKLIESVGPDLEVKMSHRNCLACEKKLTEATYYYHIECRPAAFMNSDLVTYNITWNGSS